MIWKGYFVHETRLALNLKTETTHQRQESLQINGGIRPNKMIAGEGLKYPEEFKKKKEKK